MPSQREDLTGHNGGAAVHPVGDAGIRGAMIAIGVMATLVVLAFYLFNAT